MNSLQGGGGKTSLHAGFKGILENTCHPELVSGSLCLEKKVKEILNSHNSGETQISTFQNDRGKSGKCENNTPSPKLGEGWGEVRRFFASLRMTGKKKIAFTLAEVLITLGIIGVVAAMTLPTLIQNYKKQAVLNQVKKAYAEITQALKMAEVDHGEPSSWTYGTAFDGPSAEYFMNTYIVPYMKIIKNCGTGTGCLNGDAYSLGGVKNNYNYGDSSPRTAKAIVSSGYTIGVVSGGTYANIQITLNNKNSDRIIMGKDQFQFAVPQKFPLRDRDVVLSEETEFGCHKAANDGAGMGCLELIVKDGWEIRDDYPVKF